MENVKIVKLKKKFGIIISQSSEWFQNAYFVQFTVQNAKTLHLLS